MTSSVGRSTPSVPGRPGSSGRRNRPPPGWSSACTPRRPAWSSRLPARAISRSAGAGAVQARTPAVCRGRRHGRRTGRSRTPAAADALGSRPQPGRRRRYGGASASDVSAVTGSRSRGPTPATSSRRSHRAAWLSSCIGQQRRDRRRPPGQYEVGLVDDDHPHQERPREQGRPHPAQGEPPAWPAGAEVRTVTAPSRPSPWWPGR